VASLGLGWILEMAVVVRADEETGINGVFPIAGERWVYA
jgi:hypothetical protein